VAINERDVRAFIMSRRGRVTPGMAGLPADDGPNRRVPGLRREEVAVLAGVSVDYYTRLERGDLRGVSDSVLHAIAGALQLDEAEREHLLDLARAASSQMPRRRSAPGRGVVRPHVQRLVDAFVDIPVVVRNQYFDYVTANSIGSALFSPLFDEPAPNSARFAFLNPAARDFYVQWKDTAEDLVAVLRGEAGRSPFDKRLTDLVGELSTRSPEFRKMWAAQHVRHHRGGIKKLHHPLVGDLELVYEALSVPADPNLAISTYAAPPNSPAEQSLHLLAIWSTTSSSALHVGESGTNAVVDQSS
jgi:hypothetical protein